MIKVRIPITIENDNWLMHVSFSRWKLKDRPCHATAISKLDEDVYYGFLTDEFHDWFKENNIPYDVDFSYPYSIIFEKESDAILFKLTWC